MGVGTTAAGGFGAGGSAAIGDGTGFCSVFCTATGAGCSGFGSTDEAATGGAAIFFSCKAPTSANSSLAGKGGITPETAAGSAGFCVTDAIGVLILSACA